jgi:hypothetical protein
VRFLSKETDDLDIFGAFVASELRGMKHDSNRRKVKRTIQRVILDALEKEEEETFATPQPSRPTSRSSSTMTGFSEQVPDNSQEMPCNYSFLLNM